jgi:hypothetical protein
MTQIAIYIDDNNNMYRFRVDGATVFVYAECYLSAIHKLESLYGSITIKD